MINTSRQLFLSTSSSNFLDVLDQEYATAQVGATSVSRWDLYFTWTLLVYNRIVQCWHTL